MQKLVVLESRPSSAVDANQDCDVTITTKPPEVMLARTREVLNFLGLGNITLQPVPNPELPSDLPHAFYTEPRALFAALGKKLSPRDYSAVTLKVLERYGDTISYWLRGVLTVGLVKPDSMNLKGWSARAIDQPAGTINVYEVGVSPVTRFAMGNEVFNIAARHARKPVVAAGAIPSGLLEWAIAFAFFPELKIEIICTDLRVVHPGTRLSFGRGSWPDVSRCKEWEGHAFCFGGSDGNVDPDGAMFALL